MNYENHLKQINETMPLVDGDKLADNFSLEDTKNLLNPLRVKGYGTQFPDLNIVGGLKEESLIVVVADSGVGKSIFTIGLVLHQLDRGLGCVYLDLENGKSRTVERFLRVKGQYDQDTLLGLTEEDVMQQVQSLGKLDYLSPIQISGLTAELKKTDETIRVRDVLKRKIIEKVKAGYKIFVIDPFSRACEDNAGTEFFDEGTLAGELADMAENLKIVIIAVHHMRKGNRTVYIKNQDELEEKSYVMPTGESVKGSAKILHRATDVWGIVRFREENNPIEGAILAILKSRTGELRNIKLEFDKPALTFNPYRYTFLDRVFDHRN